eukprot:Plantae.Rhodophyta-Palmaria_palmata.ctg24224.p1 GENE.Plantae.Rhodophyta-Palmaria_palmata.ctg24224~~Plantae.Rhodophyta-Palmaria_palmata.ctg24224.p1  ORF type:complete len:100 (-),score=8.21 Plantae.Rhodophyta-Palmaria_palmata.ctg24224:280-579(-)
MDRLKQFFRATRASTGKTQDSFGRFYGAVFILDPKIRSMRSKQTVSLKRARAGDSTTALLSSHATHEESRCGLFSLALEGLADESGSTFVPVSASAVCD